MFSRCSSKGDSQTVEAVSDPRRDDETLEETDEEPKGTYLPPKSPGDDTISIDDSVGSIDKEFEDEEDNIHATSMAMLKGTLDVKSLIPDLDALDGGDGSKPSPLESLLQEKVNSMDEDSTIVSMNTVERQSAIERAVQEAFEEALQVAVKQHTQSISTTAANHLMQRLRRDGAQVFD